MPIAFLPIPVLSEQQIASFHEKYEIFWPGGCWEWKRGKTEHGYGRVGIRGKAYTATRIAYSLFYGVDPGELEVTHICNNPPCMNPLHFVLGTHQDNVQYMVKCGRHLSATKPERVARGSRHGSVTKPESRAFGKRNAAYLYPERIQRGSAHHHAKLNEDDVMDILILNDSGMYKNKHLCAIFDIAPSTATNILNGNSWTHVFKEFMLYKSMSRAS